MLKDIVHISTLLYFITAQKLMKIEKLSQARTEINLQLTAKATHDHKAAIQENNKKMHVLSPNFQVQNYVLVADYRASGTPKLQLKWKGSHPDDWGVELYVVVENMLTEEVKAAHATHLRFYQSK
jgi:hypothetical protein